MIQAVVKKGQVVAKDVPDLVTQDDFILIKVDKSCISIGTESSTVSQTSKSLLERVIEKPEHFKKSLSMAMNEGVAATYSKIKGKLDTDHALGYSVSGQVVGFGKNVSGYSIGDRVAAAGSGFAHHAEFVNVPKNLVAKMPKNLSYEEACTVALGAIALQGVRRADLKIGENAVVIGAGLLGLLSLQILKASGVRTFMTDIDSSRLQTAESLGADQVLNAQSPQLLSEVNNFTEGYGADAVLFTAATSSSEPLAQAFHMCKRKGKVVMVGVANLDINRNDIYAKELDFLMSTSYGPGRYDNSYEEKGIDYPYSYVRWTQNRNMQEYLRLLSENKISIEKLSPKKYLITEVQKAFDDLNNPNSKPLVSILDYDLKVKVEKVSKDHIKKIDLSSSHQGLSKNKLNVAIIGTGNYASNVHLPNLKKLSQKFSIQTIVSRDALKAKNAAQMFSAENATTDIDDVLNNAETDLVIISTRHNNHAELILKCLTAGKNVFVEKPLCVNMDELKSIKDFYESDLQNRSKLFIGFNRRYSPLVNEVKKQLNQRKSSVLIEYRMNAGYIPHDHWVHSDGGRIIGEACHCIDLVKYLVGSSVVTMNTESLTHQNSPYSSADNKVITLKFEDGSVAKISYFSIGSSKLEKEKIDIHFDGKSIILDDFKNLSFYGIEASDIRNKNSDKGQTEELEVVYNTITKDLNAPIPVNDMIDTTYLSILAAQS